MNLAIIIVSYNVRDLLARCLDAVFAAAAGFPAGGVRVIVVDNAWADGSADMVAERFPQVELMRSPENLGFAAGNFVGILIEERLAMGNLIIRVITRKDATELVSFLWKSGYGVTSVDAMGEGGPVKLIFSIVKRKKLGQIIEVIKRFNPNAFYTVEDVRFVNETFLPAIGHRTLFSLDFLRKRK